MGISSIELVRRVAAARPVFVRSTKQRALTIHLLSATVEVMSAVGWAKVRATRALSQRLIRSICPPTHDRPIEMVGTALHHSCGEAVKAGRAFAHPTIHVAGAAAVEAGSRASLPSPLEGEGGCGERSEPQPGEGNPQDCSSRAMRSERTPSGFL